jgi:hypothetical protein
VPGDHLEHATWLSLLLGPPADGAQQNGEEGPLGVALRQVEQCVRRCRADQLDACLAALPRPLPPAAACSVAFLVTVAAALDEPGMLAALASALPDDRLLRNASALTAALMWGSSECVDALLARGAAFPQVQLRERMLLNTSLREDHLRALVGCVAIREETRWAAHAAVAAGKIERAVLLDKLGFTFDHIKEAPGSEVPPRVAEALARMGKVAEVLPRRPRGEDEDEDDFEDDDYDEMAAASPDAAADEECPLAQSLLHCRTAHLRRYSAAQLREPANRPLLGRVLRKDAEHRNVHAMSALLHAGADLGDTDPHSGFTVLHALVATETEAEEPLPYVMLCEHVLAGRWVRPSAVESPAQPPPG